MNEYISANSIHDLGIDINKRTIFLHGESDKDSDPGMDWRSANRFLKNMHILNGRIGDIVIHSHNIGGEWESGMVVYDMIRSCRSIVTMICHGEVSSMGTIILQAADRRISMPNCTFMLHYGDIEVTAPYPEFKSMAKIEEQRINQMLDIYIRVCKNAPMFEGRTEKQIRRSLEHFFMSKGSWYLNAEEAKDYGIVDEVLE